MPCVVLHCAVCRAALCRVSCCAVPCVVLHCAVCRAALCRVSCCTVPCVVLHCAVKQNLCCRDMVMTHSSAMTPCGSVMTPCGSAMTPCGRAMAGLLIFFKHLPGRSTFFLNWNNVSLQKLITICFSVLAQVVIGLWHLCCGDVVLVPWNVLQWRGVVAITSVVVTWC